MKSLATKSTTKSKSLLALGLAVMALASCSGLQGEGALDEGAEGIETRQGAVVTTTVRVDTGSNTANGIWSADVGASGGTQQTHAEHVVDTSAVANPAPMSAYQSGRIGNFTYTFTGFTPNLNGTVRLHFAETFWTASGKRVFNVYINGTKVLFNYDIFAAALGQWKANAQSFSVPSSAQGEYIIRFETVTDNAWVSAIEITPPSACAGGTAGQAFGGDMTGCAGAVTFGNRASLCGTGYHVATPTEWATFSGGVAPSHHYWTDEALGYSGTGSNSCAATTLGSGSACDNPMRVCASSGTDASGNVCNWTNCGLDSKGPNLYFGGCSGNTTAGTLCVRSACANGEATQTFGGGMIGCAAAKSQANAAALCMPGWHEATSYEWLELKGAKAPLHNYWISDSLTFVSGPSGGCSAFASTPTNFLPCPSPVRVCTASGSDAEGNSCGVVECGHEGLIDNYYLGGCTAGTSGTAGAVCVHGHPAAIYPGKQALVTNNATTCEHSPWPGGVIPYVFLNTNVAWRQQVRGAMDDWQAKTKNAVIFVEDTANRPDHAVIQCNPTFGAPGEACGLGAGGITRPGYRGLYNDAGGFIRLIDPPTLAGSPNLIGFTMHELGHIIGLMHEHMRGDRARYTHVLPNYVRVQNDVDQNWAQCGTADRGSVFGLMDLTSTMNYGSGPPSSWMFQRSDMMTEVTTGLGQTTAKDASNVREQYGYQRGWQKFFPLGLDLGEHMPYSNKVSAASTVTLKGKAAITSQGGRGNDDVYIRGTDGHLYFRNQIASAWNGFTDIGSGFDGDPGAASWGNNSSHVVIGAGSVLKHRQLTGAGWQPWVTLPAQPVARASESAPGVIARGTGNLVALYRATDGKIYQTTYASGAWASSWSAIPNAPAGISWISSPAGVHFSSALYQVFMTTTAGHIYGILNTNGVWGSWVDIVSNASNSNGPAAAAWGPTRVDLVYRGSDGLLNWTYNSSGTWKTPVSLGGVLSSAPTVAAELPGRLMVVALGADGALWRRQYQPARNDYDGDGKADTAYVNPSDFTWHVRKSSDGTEWTPAVQWGVANDHLAPGDYDGDGKIDAAVFRPSDGTWHVRFGNGTQALPVTFGASGDRAAPGDYDGDGRADYSVFRPSTGHWYVRLSSGAADLDVVFGTSTDTLAPGDYNGDGATDFGFYRPSDKTYHVKTTFGAAMPDVTFAITTTAGRAVPGDYDGDGIMDRAVFNPTDGTWNVRFSTSNNTAAYTWGVSTDVVQPADFDGDGRTDPAIYRPSTNTWWVLPAIGTASFTIPYGASGATPVAFVTPN